MQLVVLIGKLPKHPAGSGMVVRVIFGRSEFLPFSRRSDGKRLLADSFFRSRKCTKPLKFAFMQLHVRAMESQQTSQLCIYL